MELREQIREHIIKNYGNTTPKESFLRGLYQVCIDYYKKESEPGLSKEEKKELFQEIFDAFDLAVYDLSERDEMKFRTLSVILSEYSFKNYLKDKVDFVAKFGKPKKEEE